MGDRPTDPHWEFDPKDDDTKRGRIGQWIGFAVLVIISLFVLAPASGPAQSHSFAGGGWSTDWNTAIRTSNETGNRVLVLFNASWCPGCESFETQVLARPDIRRHLESRYTLVLVDLSRNDAQAKAIIKQYNIEVFPTLILYNRGGSREIARCYGLSATDLLLWLRSDGRAVRQIIE